MNDAWLVERGNKGSAADLLIIWGWITCSLYLDCVSLQYLRFWLSGFFLHDFFLFCVNITKLSVTQFPPLPFFFFNDFMKISFFSFSGPLGDLLKLIYALTIVGQR